MARDFRPKDQSAKARANGQHPHQTRPRNVFQPKQRTAPAHTAHKILSRLEDHDQDGDTDNANGETEAELKEAIAALGGDDDDLELVSSRALRKKSKAKSIDEGEDVVSIAFCTRTASCQSQHTLTPSSLIPPSS